MHRRIALAVAFLVAFAVPALAQDVTPPTPAGGRSLDLGIRGYGLSAGNAPRWNGLRINLVDRDLQRVNGVNLTLWRPRGNPDAVIRGAAVGLLAPEAREITGLSAGGLAVVTERRLRGVGLGGLAIVSGGPVEGVHAAGLAIVSEGGLAGLNVAGLANVSSGEMRGINLAGLAAVARGDLRWANLTGLAAVSQGAVEGLTLSGLAVVAARGVTGLTVGGLAVVSGLRPITGVTLTLGAVESDDGIYGLTVGGYRVKGPRVVGFSVNPIMLKARDFTGVAIGGHNEVMGTQRGLSIGLYNFARRLDGVQIGLLNYAGNNPVPLRLLPLINLHFD